MSLHLNRPMVAMTAKGVNIKIISDLATDELPTGVWAWSNVDVDVFGSGELLVTDGFGNPMLLLAGGTWRLEFLTPADEVFANTTQEARK